MKLSNVGERGFVSRSIGILSGMWVPGVLLPGDDASSYYMGGSWLLIKIDGFSAYSSKYPWNSWGDLGWKAVTSCASDIIAKGGTPYIYLISIGAPADFSLEYAMELVRGFEEALRFYGGLFGGGDTNSSREDVWVDVACIGSTSVDPIPRGGLPGDRILITGRFGFSGLARIYYEKLLKGEIKLEEIPERVLSATSRPTAKSGIEYILRRYRGCIRGSIDVSDSLAESLYQLSEASGYEIDLYESPSDPLALKIAEKIGADPIDIVFNGGEEYELVLSVDKACAESIVRDMREKGFEASIYGVITENRGTRILYRGIEIPRIGYQHFISI
jgi:thiamine-monophosphate kinase